MAFSRVKALDQLFIIRQSDAKHIKADPKVHREYECLRCPALIPPIADVNVKNSDN